MPATLVYMLRNKTNGIDTSHDSLNSALDAINDNVGNSDVWIVEESPQGQPTMRRFVCGGRGHTRAYDGTPPRDRRGARR
jgi:hypothetical protein